MKKLPIGIQNIDRILSEGYLYVDKTGFALNLVQNSKHYFMSRPRRFGKSLFLNTLMEIFKGNKSLFKGCKIYESDYKWEKHPPVYFDFSSIPNRTPEVFETGLKETLAEIADSFGISITGSSVQLLLKSLVKGLAKKNRVVVLIDEYDQPIINNLKNPAIAEQNRDLLKDFFATLKSLDKYIQFTFVTGVSKFSQVSLFSGPNHLLDITMDPEYAGMMGYTEEELRYYFEPHIQEMVREKGNSKDEVVKEVRTWYNGYRFSEKELSVYNPYSTLRFFHAKKAESYWYSSGTPSFLIDEVKKHPRDLAPLSGTTALKSALLDINELTDANLTALMFQTGYLTIQDYSTSGLYYLGFPNQEVQQAFFGSLVHCFAPTNRALVAECEEALEAHDLDLFFKQIKALFASFPYHLFSKANESTYQGMFLAILKGMGLDAEAERLTNLGRIDLVINMGKTIFILECKLDKSAEDALKQIQDKKYFERWVETGKKVILVGVNFSSEERNISEWKSHFF